MAIKKFSKFVAEAPAADYIAPKDDDAEVKGYKPRSKGEEDFANQHMVQKTDYYAVPGQDHVFNGSVKEVNIQPNNGEGVQKQGASDVNQPQGGGDSKRSADKSQGDKITTVKEGLEDNTDNPANRQHLCAKNVVHEQYGEGICISEEHAEPDENGHVEWYDVMFKHGLEREVPVAEMKVTKAESHLHASKNSKKKIDEISPELAKRAFDARAKKIAKDRATAKAYDKLGDRTKDRGKSIEYKRASHHLGQKADSQIDKLNRSGDKAKMSTDDQIKGYDKATDTRSPTQKYSAYRKGGGKLSYDQYKSQYLKQDFEVEGDLIEGKVMDGLKKIVDKKSAGSVKFANGKTLQVDMTTANAMLNLYKKINDKNKKSMEDKIEKSPEVFMKLMDVAFGGK